MTNLPNCPACGSALTYEDQSMFVCPDCAHEWSAAAADAATDEARVIKDAYGTVLTDGDTVMLIKDLKVKGAGTTLKSGTKVKNIRLVEGDHDIDCKVEAIGAMQLKSQFVKKV